MFPILMSDKVSSISALARVQDIWDVVCWFCTGNSVMNLVKVKDLRSSTMFSPAFILLSGVDSDGYLIPWCDRANVLQHNIKGRHPSENIALCLPGVVSRFDRHMSAIQVADVVERNVDILSAPHWKGYYSCGGPARPSSPCVTVAKYSAPPYAYLLPNPCLNDWKRSDLAPPVFPPDEHSRESLRYFIRSTCLFASPDDSGSDSSTSS